MLPGRKPKPTTLKVIEGNPGKRTLNNRPKAPPLAPACPRWLDLEAKREWRRIVPGLLALGILTGIDRTALAAYCQAYSRWRAVEEIIQQDGLLIVGSHGGKQQHPAVLIARQQMQLLRAFCAEFGMTPSSRGRIEVPELLDEEEAFFGP